tara:strand:- start:823 stop:1221 length:399 start_codon:yes stop_codon:yes gene_type:complete
MDNANNSDLIISNINNNKYFYAVAMILLNMGSKYIDIDLGNGHKKFLSSKILRRVVIFTVAFVATRDIIASLIITASFVILVLNLFNTKSDNCILPKTLRDLDLNNDGEISADEIERAYNILKKAGKIKDSN